MTYEITRKTLWDSRRLILGWLIGFAGVTALYTGFYALLEPGTYEDMLASFPEDLLAALGWDDFASPAGYLGSTVYGLIAPILLAIFAIGLGARYLAGDEESGILELTMTHPVSRVSLVLQRTASAALAALSGAVVIFLVVFLLLGPVDLDIPVRNVFAASVQLGLLGVVFATFTLAVGGFIGRRGIAIAVAAALAVLGYFGATIIPTVEGFEWFENLSVFHYYDGQTALEEGFNLAGSVVLLGLSVVFSLAAVLGFTQRDVGTA